MYSRLAILEGNFSGNGGKVRSFWAPRCKRGAEPWGADERLRQKFVLWTAAILDHMCDLSRDVVEDAVKAAGGRKRRNISWQAKSLVGVSPLRASDLCYDLVELAKLVMRELWARRKLFKIWRRKRAIRVRGFTHRIPVWRRWSCRRYSSLTMKTCLSRRSRPKGQFVLYIIKQGSPCSKQCHAKVLQDISECLQWLCCWSRRL